MAVLEHGNPYTHEEHRRASTTEPRILAQGCVWCGQVKRVLYNYDRQRRTGGGLAWVCNKGCAQDYQG